MLCSDKAVDLSEPFDSNGMLITKLLQGGESMVRSVGFKHFSFASKAESEREGTRAETRIGLSAKRRSPFKSAGGSVQSNTGSRVVRISRQDYWLPTPFASFPFTSRPVRHRVPSHSDSALQRLCWRFGVLKSGVLKTV